MVSSRKMSPEGHRESGRLLFDIRNALLAFSSALPYPKSSTVRSKAHKAVQAVDSLRAKLDGILAAEAATGDFNPRTYYPGNGNGFEQTPRNGRICYRTSEKPLASTRNECLPLAGVRCTVDRLEYDFTTRTGRLDLPAGHCTDMAGAIRLFQAIDPHVRRIETTAAKSGDTTYICTDGEWESQRGARR